MSKRGRPTEYTDDIAAEICRRLAGGESLRRICSDDHLPNDRTVRQWAADNRNGFYPQYARARDLGLDVMADEIIDIADDGQNDYIETEDGREVLNGEHIQRSRLRVDSRKWYLSKLAPKRYGDRMAHEHTGKDGGPIETRDLTDLEFARRVAFALAKGVHDDDDGA